MSPGRLSQYDTVSVDGATVSQAITFCDRLIDYPFGDYALAMEVASMVNANLLVGEDVIDISTPIIMYRELPLTFDLAQNYPNPFNPSTVINYSLPEAGHVKLKVFNLVGQVVAVLVDGHKNAGYHSSEWSCGEHASGMYFFRLQSNGNIRSRKMLLLK